MSNKTYNRPEITIDLRKLVWSLLSQWKAILLVSLLMAAVFCGAKHMADIKAMTAEQEEIAKQATGTADEQIEQVMSLLSEEDKDKVEYIIEQKALVDEYLEYIKKSIAFNTNTSNQRTLLLTYDIDVEKKGDLPVLVRSFQNYVIGDKFAQDLKDTIQPDSDTVFISELVQIEPFNQADLDIVNNSGALKFYILLPEEVDSEAVSTAATNSLIEYQSILNKRYPGVITNAGSQEAHLFDETNAEKKTKVFNSINTINNNIKAAENALSESQKSAVDKIMKIKKEIEVAEAEEMTANASEKGKAPAPGWSKKYALLGFIFGLFLYAGTYILLLIIRGCTDSASSAEKYTESRLLGEVYFEREKMGFFNKLLKSKHIDNWYYRGKKDSEKQANEAAKSIEAICAYEGIDALTVLNMIEDDRHSDKLMGLIKEYCSEFGVALNELDVSKELDEKKICLLNDVVIAIDDNTKIIELNRLKNLCSEYSTSIKGSLFSALI